MGLISSLMAIDCGAMLVVCVLFVVFGEVTVRKLRKNPKTKDSLGIVPISGWDILNVAGALSMPRIITRRWKRSDLSFLMADADLLKKHTTVFDRALGRIFFLLGVFSTFCAIILLVLDKIGVLK